MTVNVDEELGGHRERRRALTTEVRGPEAGRRQFSARDASPFVPPPSRRSSRPSCTTSDANAEHPNATRIVNSDADSSHQDCTRDDLRLPNKHFIAVSMHRGTGDMCTAQLTSSLASTSFDPFFASPDDRVWPQLRICMDIPG